MSAERQSVVKPAAAGLSGARFGMLQRKCACGGSSSKEGECEECKQKGMSLQRRAAGGGTQAAVPPVVHEVLRSPGQPLDPATRAFMEPRFGHDFGKVRVHADARAAESAGAVNALAYTVGNDIVFGRGLYAPGQFSWRRLLAHELAHVVQQGVTGPEARTGSGQRPLTIGDAYSPLEADAEHAATQALDSHRVDPAARRAPNGVVQRKTDLDPFSIQLAAGDLTNLSDADLNSLVTRVRSKLIPMAKDSPDYLALKENSDTLEAEVTRRMGNQAKPAERPKEKPDASGPQQVPVGLTYQVVGVVGESAGKVSGADLAGLSLALTTTVGSGIPAIPSGGTSTQSTGDPSTPTFLPGLVAAPGTGVPRFLNPLPAKVPTGGPNVFTRFIGPEEGAGFFEPGRFDPSSELTPRLGQATRGSAAEAARFEAFDLFRKQGISPKDLGDLGSAVRSKGVTGLSAEEFALYRRVVALHGQVSGATPASPLVSLTELSPEQALQKLPPVATRRAYVVRVRIDPKDVGRVNEILNRTGQSPKGLTGELEVVVAQDLRGQGAEILSITRNVAPGAPLAGFAGAALQWTGRGLVVLGAALAVKDIVTAEGPHRRETEGHAFGSFAGATVLGAFGAGLCVGLGIATAGAGLLLCGLAFGAVGAFGGGALGGAVGRQFD